MALKMVEEVLNGITGPCHTHRSGASRGWWHRVNRHQDVVERQRCGCDLRRRWRRLPEGLALAEVAVAFAMAAMVHDGQGLCLSRVIFDGWPRWREMRRQAWPLTIC